jgi:exosortase A-associated hydrolase 2
VLYVHPFAEEMNKSRRMAALQSVALAKAGYTVLQIDLHGCGDSAGDFGDASWQGWVDDVVAAAQWLGTRSNGPLWLWGLRAGCLLTVAAAARLSIPVNMLFWAPTPIGKTLLQQFLRLKAAADMIGGQAKLIMESTRQQLASGQAVEIAGYALAPAVAQGLEQATLSPIGNVHRLVWLEVSTRTDATLTPAASGVIQRWEKAGAAVESRMVPGPAFWQTTEIEEALDLLLATTEMLLSPVRESLVTAAQADLIA